jgi:hypothetical protein
MEIHRKPNGYWTELRIYEAASKYETVNDFYKGDYQAYAKAANTGILGDVIKDLKRLRKEKTHLSDVEVFEIVNKCETKKEFREDNRPAYNYACSRGFLKECVTGLVSAERKNGYSEEEIEIIKENYTHGGSSMVRWALEYKGHKKRSKSAICQTARNLGITCDVVLLKPLPAYVQHIILKRGETYSARQFHAYFKNIGYATRIVDIEFFIKCVKSRHG